MATIRYIVRDVDEAVTFYTGHLGFTLDKKMGPAIAFVTLGRVAYGESLRRL